MSRFSATTIKTGVKIVATILLLSFAAQSAQADPPRKKSSSSGSSDSSSSGSDSSSSNNNNNNNSLAALIGASSDCDRTLSDGAKSCACRDAKRDAKDAVNKLGTACKDAGLQIKSCSSSAMSCSNAAGSSSFDSVNSLMNSMGLANGTPISSGCPQYSGKDYTQRADSISKDLKNAQKDLADMNDDKAKLQDDFSKDQEDLNKSLQDAQDDYNKQSAQIDKDQQSQVKQAQDTLNQQKTQSRQLTTQLLNLQGQMNSAQLDKANKLLALTDAEGTRECIKAMQDEAKSFSAVINPNGSGSTSSSGYIGNSKLSNSDKLATYNDCMTTFQNKRIAVNTAADQTMKQLQKASADTQSELDDLNDSINTAATQNAQTAAAATTQKNQAYQKVTQLLATSQTRLQSLTTKYNTNMQTLANKMTQGQQEVNRLSTSMSKLGPDPGNNSTSSPVEASNDIFTSTEVIQNADRTCHDDNGNPADLYPGLNGSGSSSSKGSGSSRKGAQ